MDLFKDGFELLTEIGSFSEREKATKKSIWKSLQNLQNMVFVYDF